MDISVSVIIPVHGTDPVQFERCLKSISSAWGKPLGLEIVIVFDGAPSEGLSLIASRFSENGDKVIKQEQTGVSSARNTGLNHAQGKWVAFVDSDDALPPISLQQLICFGEEHDCDMVFGNHRKVMLNGDEVVCYSNCSRTPSPRFKEKLQHDVLNPVTGASPLWGKVYRRDVIAQNEIKFNEGLKIGEDTDFVFRMLLASERPGFISECTYIYFRNDSSSTMSFNTEYPNYVISSMKAMKTSVTQMCDADAYEDDFASYCLFHLMLVMVHYIFNRNAGWDFARQRREYFKILNDDLYKAALDQWSPRHFGASRDIMILSMKYHLFYLSKTIASVRERQIRGRKQTKRMGAAIV